MNITSNTYEAGARKRRSRWGNANERTDLSASAFAGNASGQELDRFAIQVRLEEITKKLRTGDVVPPERERSPSPEPTYDSHGRRTNTREVRYRRKLEDERTRLIERQMRVDPSVKTGVEFHSVRRNGRPTEKIYLPVREFPEINFFGLLCGPRGNTLKKMTDESGAKIHIRGRGSRKVGKGVNEDDDEDMHCIVTADNERSLKHCIQLINEVVSTAASTPETQNDHKRSQLRELAVLNGTLRDDENQMCQNCGEKGHRKFECPHDRNWTSHITCHRCGQQGHIARDCMMGRGGFDTPVDYAASQNPVDSEYATLMAELGERPGASSAGGYLGVPGYSGPPLNERGEKIPPWRDPKIWNAPGPGRNRDTYRDTYDQSWDQPAYMCDPTAYTWDPATYPTAEGQRDYAAEWAAYYAAQAQAQGAQPAEGQRDYTKEWEEYYRQQALAQGQAPSS